MQHGTILCRSVLTLSPARALLDQSHSQLEFRTNRIRENLGGEQRVVSRFNHKRLKHRFNRIILRGDAQLQIQDQPRFDMLLIGKLGHYPKSEESW
jgi:hypothetical protein